MAAGDTNVGFTLLTKNLRNQALARGRSSFSKHGDVHGKLLRRLVHGERDDVLQRNSRDAQGLKAAERVKLDIYGCNAVRKGSLDLCGGSGRNDVHPLGEDQRIRFTHGSPGFALEPVQTLEHAREQPENSVHCGL